MAGRRKPPFHHSGHKAINPGSARAGPRSKEVFSLFNLGFGGGLGPPAARAALEHMAMMQQAVEHGADGGGIAEQAAPVFHRAIGSQQSAAAFVAAHDDFQQILGGGVGQFTHSEVVEDEQRNGGDGDHIFFTRTAGYGVGQFVKQDVRFAVQHLMALKNGRLPDGLGQVALAAATGAEKQSVFALGDEGGGG